MKKKPIKAFKDWKFYIFHLIPCLALVIFLIVLIVKLKTKNDVNLNEGILFVIVVLYTHILASISVLISFFKKKNIASTVFAIVLMVALIIALVASVFYMVEFIKLAATEAECNVLYEQYLQIDPANVELSKEKYDIWQNAKDDLLSKQMELSITVMCTIFALMVLEMIINTLAGNYEKKDNGDEPNDTPPQNNTTIY